MANSIYLAFVSMNLTIVQLFLLRSSYGTRPNFDQAGFDLSLSTKPHSLNILNSRFSYFASEFVRIPHNSANLFISNSNFDHFLSPSLTISSKSLTYTNQTFTERLTFPSSLNEVKFKNCIWSNFFSTSDKGGCFGIQGVNEATISRCLFINIITYTKFTAGKGAFMIITDTTSQSNEFSFKYNIMTNVTSTNAYKTPVYHAFYVINKGSSKYSSNSMTLYAKEGTYSCLLQSLSSTTVTNSNFTNSDSKIGSGFNVEFFDRSSVKISYSLYSNLGGFQLLRLSPAKEELFDRYQEHGSSLKVAKVTIEHVSFLENHGFVLIGLNNNIAQYDEEYSTNFQIKFSCQSNLFFGNTNMTYPFYVNVPKLNVFTLSEFSNCVSDSKLVVQNEPSDMYYQTLVKGWIVVPRPTKTSPEPTDTPSLSQATPTQTETPKPSESIEIPTQSPIQTPAETPKPSESIEIPTQSPIQTPTETPAPSKSIEIPTETPKPSESIEIPTQSPNPTPTETPAPSKSIEIPTETPNPTPTETPTPSESIEIPTQSPNSTPTETPMPSKSIEIPAQSPNPTPAETPTPSGSIEIPTQSPIQTPTETPKPSESIEIPTQTLNPTPTKTPTPSESIEIPTESPKPSESIEIPTETLNPTPTETPTPSESIEIPTETDTPSETPTDTDIPTAEPTYVDRVDIVKEGDIFTTTETTSSLLIEGVATINIQNLQDLQFSSYNSSTPFSEINLFGKGIEEATENQDDDYELRFKDFNNVSINVFNNYKRERDDDFDISLPIVVSDVSSFEINNGFLQSDNEITIKGINAPTKTEDLTSQITSNSKLNIKYISFSTGDTNKWQHQTVESHSKFSSNVELVLINENVDAELVNFTVEDKISIIQNSKLKLKQTRVNYRTIIEFDVNSLDEAGQIQIDDIKQLESMHYNLFSFTPNKIKFKMNDNSDLDKKIPIIKGISEDNCKQMFVSFQPQTNLNGNPYRSSCEDDQLFISIHSLQNNSKKSGKINGGIIALAVFGGIVMLVIIASLIYLFTKKKRKAIIDPSDAFEVSMTNNRGVYN